MKNKFISIFGSEWFGMVIATLAVSQVFILASGYLKNIDVKYIGEAFFGLGVALFIVISILWLIRAFTSDYKKYTHWNNLTRLSFLALVPIILFVMNHILISLIGMSNLLAEISLYNYFFSYVLALILGLLLGYRLYTKEIERSEINYAIIIPPLSIGTSIFLASELVGYYPGYIAKAIYFLVLMGLGIFFFLYIFIGSLALSGHVYDKSESNLPTVTLPVGVASLIIINLLTIMSFGNVLSEIALSLGIVEFVAVLLYGFEVWNFLIAFMMVFRKKTFGYLSVWAYGFPLGLFAVSTIKLSSVLKIPALGDVFLLIWAALIVLWVYGLINTYVFVGKVKRSMKLQSA